MTSPNAPVPVLYIIHTLGHGGMERQVAALALSLDPRRYRAHVATVLGGFGADELRAAGIPVISIPIRSFFDPGPFALARYLRTYIREHGIGLVHLYDAGLSLVARLATYHSGGALLLTSQRFYMNTQTWLYRSLLMSVHWLADGVVANSETVRRHLLDDYHFPLRRVALCYNGIDPAIFQPEPRRRLDGVADASLVIGCVCVLRPEKNLGHLLQAFARVRGIAPPGTRLLIVGSGPEEANLHRLAAELGIMDACCFQPSTTEVAAALRSIDIFVHPSLSESLPNSVMEAMACACCVIATRVGGCAELMEHGVQGLLCPPNDLESLVQQLESTIRQPELRQSLGTAAAQRIASEFSLARATRRMQEIYDQHLGRSPC